ncbi:hypothetical protein DL96DRAFT_1549921 [Flagelloscypha sp. PMI_526]|nr:hypothetical protein DL96DRAFT_1549921 [Flagelloscypha sp. PMI_526]
MSSLAARPLVTGLKYPETRIQPSSHLQRSQRWSASTFRSIASSLPQVESGTLPEFTPRLVPEVDTRQQTGSRGLRVDGSPDSRLRSVFSNLVPSFERRQDSNGDDLLLQPPADPSTEFVSSLAFTATSEPTATSSLEPSLTVSTPSTAVPSSVSTITSVPAGRPTSDTGMGQTFQLGNITVTKAMLIGLGVVGAVVLIGMVVGLLFCLSIRRRRKALLTSDDYEKKETKYLTSEAPKALPVVEPFMAQTPLQPVMITPFAPSRPVNPFAHYRPADMALDAPTLRRGEMRINPPVGAPAMSIAPPTPVLSRPVSRLVPIEVATPRPVSPRGAVGLPTSPYPSSRTPSPVFQVPSSSSRANRTPRYPFPD